MHDSSVVNDLEQLPVISDYAGQPLSFTSLLPTISAEDSPTLCKYWSQRYRLFSRYDQGIQMDQGESNGEGEKEGRFGWVWWRESQHWYIYYKYTRLGFLSLTTFTTCYCTLTCSNGWTTTLLYVTLISLTE